MTGWLTNNPTAARKLRAVDKKYEKARKALPPMPLAEKIEAIKRLKESRAMDYARVLETV